MFRDVLPSAGCRSGADSRGSCSCQCGVDKHVWVLAHYLFRPAMRVTHAQFAQYAGKQQCNVSHTSMWVYLRRRGCSIHQPVAL